MSGLIKKSLSFSLLRRAGGFLTPGSLNSQHVIRNLSSSKVAGILLHQPAKFCNCNLCIRNINTNGVLRATAGQVEASSQSEKELSDFLSTEIASEKKILKQKNLPSKIDGFEVELNESKVTLTKQNGTEIIKVSFDVSNTVDMEVDEDADNKDEQQEEIKSRPSFEVEIKGDNETLGFSCSIFPPESSQEVQENEYDDNFAIDEIFMYKGNVKSPNNYSVSGEVIDGTLYDLLMNLLDDKGISNAFVEKVIDLSTAYEQSCYINLLEKVQKFVQKY